MKLSELKIGMRVRDIYWPYIAGRVIEVKKTVVRIKFNSDCVIIKTYDNEHCQFLEKDEPNK